MLTMQTASLKISEELFSHAWLLYTVVYFANDKNRKNFEKDASKLNFWTIGVQIYSVFILRRKKMAKNTFYNFFSLSKMSSL
jgi:hypothetical protein